MRILRSTSLVLALLLVLAAVSVPVPAHVGATASVGAQRGVLPLPTEVDVDYQLGGPTAVPERVGIVVRDRTARPSGRYDVCYVNAFQTQPDEKRFWLRGHRGLLLERAGKPVVDQGWGEFLLDLRSSAKRQALARIVGRWIDGCADDGFDAVELDNLDSFTRSRGLVRRAHAVAYSRLLVRAAHRAGLAVGQKNLAGWDGTRIGFDFAVTEECGRYRECGRYVAHYGDQVLAVEYRRRDFTRTCAAYGDRLAVVLRDRAVSPRGVRAWC